MWGEARAVKEREKNVQGVGNRVHPASGEEGGNFEGAEYGQIWFWEWERRQAGKGGRTRAQGPRESLPEEWQVCSMEGP